ncbi:FAD-dependent oxidoreductase [Halohasta salina]|uniref:FAD-dependent oxidoreductase n=1 Tax=Halohasta salina TaxID=2961621 RepID=UPI0020A59871|nr:hypothetical protein [Halohasta salina]
MPQFPVGGERPVLVVGRGLTAAATAGFLDQAGLDPVVAPTAERGRVAGVTVLWRPGLVLLERIGLRRPIERVGTALESHRCLTTGRSTTAAEGDRPAVVAVDRARLAELIEATVYDRVRTVDRPVRRVEQAAAGVEVGFEGGLTESFDAVVTTTRSLPPERSAPTPDRGVHSWSFDWPAGRPTPQAPAAVWDRRRAALFVPTADRTHVRLVSTAGVDAASALSIDDLEGRFGGLFETADGLFAALDQHRLRYARSAAVTPTTVTGDGVVVVGAAGRPALPGDCLGAALDIEAAWVIADALAYGPEDIDAALEAYQCRRRRRQRVIAEAVAAATDDPPVDLDPVLRWLRTRRRLAFGHTDDGNAALAESIPDRL